jgi:hypothetical protein
MQRWWANIFSVLNRDEVTFHFPDKCKICAEIREYPERIRKADEREKLRREKAEAKKLQKQVVNRAAQIARSARDASGSDD